jgi:hypothetical protein
LSPRKELHGGCYTVELMGCFLRPRTPLPQPGDGGIAAEACPPHRLIAVVALRDSKDSGRPVLVFTPDDGRAFTAAIKAGEFDLA